MISYMRNKISYLLKKLVEFFFFLNFSSTTFPLHVWDLGLSV